MHLGTTKETAAGERRVALTPAVVARLVKKQHEVTIEQGAGEAAGFADEDYAAAGATLSGREAVLRGVELLVQVQANDLVEGLPEGRTLVAQTDPLSRPQHTRELATRGHRVFALELVPRITRAQSMDVLSSMASLAGYKAVLLAAAALPKQFPMAMTAAGTIKPARVFVIGAGVAGLQAIATAKRLGAVVRAYDVRPAVKEQVESLGAKFVEMDLETGEGEGGYAKELDEAFYTRQRELMTEVLGESDVVITTAAVPGKKAPPLVTAEMVHAMQPGAVICDLAAERGGNCELTVAGETILERGVAILGPTNVPATLARDASLLYANNVLAFLGEILDSDGDLSVDLDNEVVAATLVCEDGELVHPLLRELNGLPERVPTPPEPEIRTMKLAGDD